MARTRKWRCTYSFPCGPYDRHCYEAVPIDAVDPPGRCNDDAAGENPDWMPDNGEPLYDEPKAVG